ncbi:tRNA threonylcarbamoyladenosine biosynthesis protein TsaE [Chitinophaga sp. CF118]|uniref:tRNA (adenosine(37)-N6)-threonylcarbamoyltransferase complex ATPase subunit type 1 TsaE n=1 Tax=Chitinophaga sp. CF118 TaxID=1884367 RepID=UPI0008E0FCEB|nr:tRNA (adenosine(37)-N6)-threonylcarbamoyltransferase complex ATPase subunit type 1 TsaE [Chitinophaga sp. CF118]SFE32129.1 tRNA threonylcarbamoyladenosine biosynthesis protein TsaE [Chitinophaga sp. CF118]
MEWIFSEEQLPATVQLFWQYYKEQHVFTLEGPMGAGKTTLVKALCAARGVEDATASPTFSIINQYLSGDGQPIYHLDLYRLRDEEEAIAAGVEDTIYQPGAICFIEWPDIIAPLLPSDTIRLQLSVLPDQKRLLRVG